MDTWLLLVTVFSTRVLASPLPQLIGQHEVKAGEEVSISPENPFSSSVTSSNGRQFQQNFVPRSSNQGGFPVSHNGGSSLEVLRLTHPSLIEGVSSLEELGLNSPKFPTKNNFGSFGPSNGLGLSSLESGFNNQHFPVSNFGHPAFNTQGFGSQNVLPHGINFVNGGFPVPGFGSGFNPISFIGGPPFANNFFPFGHGGSQLNQNLAHGNFFNRGFIPNIPPQNSRVIVHSVPVVVGILNDTHARVAPHTQNVRQNSNNVRFGFNSERNLSGNNRVNPSQGSAGISQGIQQSSQSNPKSDSDSVHEQNDNRNRVQIGIPTSFGTTKQEVASVSTSQTEPLPVAEALIVTTNNEASLQDVNRAGFASLENSAKSNLINSEGATKFIQTNSKIAGLTAIGPTDDSTVSATSTSILSNTGFGNSFSSDADPSRIDTLQTFPNEFSTKSSLGTNTNEHETLIQTGQNSLPVLGALASFAALGTPSARNANAKSLATVLNRESSQFKTIIPADVSVLHEITTIRPDTSVLGIIRNTHVSAIPEDNSKSAANSGSLNIESGIRKHSGHEQVAEPTINDNLNTQLPSQGVMSSGIGTSIARMMHVGDHVSITPDIEQTKVEPIIQQRTIQAKATEITNRKTTQESLPLKLSNNNNPESVSQLPRTSLPLLSTLARQESSGTSTVTPEQFLITSPALSTVEVNIPAAQLSHSKFSTSKPNTPFTITPSPVSAIQSPFQTGLPVTNAEVSGIAPSVNAKTFTPHAIIIIPQQENGSAQQNFQQASISSALESQRSPSQFTDNFGKRFGEVVAAIREPHIAEGNNKNTLSSSTKSASEVEIVDNISSGSTQGQNGIQVKSLGINSQDGQATSQVLLGQSGLIPTQSETTDVTSHASVLLSSSTSPGESILHAIKELNHISDVSTAQPFQESKSLNSEATLTSSNFNDFSASLTSVEETPLSIVTRQSHTTDLLNNENPNTSTTRVQQGISTDSSSSHFSQGKQLSTHGEVSDLNVGSRTTNPNFVLTIPLSLISQSADSSTKNINAVANAQPTAENVQAANIFNNLSFTTDPVEVLRILNAQSSSFNGLNNNRATGTQASLQRSHQIEGNNFGHRQSNGEANTFEPQESTSNQQQQTITIQPEPITPGQTGVVSVPSPSPSLSFLPDTLASISKALGLGVPLPSKPTQAQSRIENLNANVNKNNQNESKLGNTLKRESPSVS